MSQKHQTSGRRQVRHWIDEVRRRHVVQVTSVYLVAVWGLSAGAADIFDVLDFPLSAARYLIIALFSLTPIVILLSWLFEVDRSGIYLDQGDDESDTEPLSAAPATTGIVLSATFQEATRSFDADFTVGRDENCEFQIIDPLISRRHTRFEQIDGRWRVKDLGSANGTSIDGQKVDVAWLSGTTVVSFYPGCPEFSVTTMADADADTVFFEEPYKPE